MSLTEQHISAQVWVCNGCGGHDRKTCSCAGATAESKEVQAAKKEAHRQAVNRSAAKKREEKQYSADNLPPVENIEESPEASAERMKAVFAAADSAASGAAPATRVRAPARRSDRVHFLITELVDSSAESRAEAVKQLVSGERQDEFKSVVEAVSDLYKKLSQAGK